jgi:hypothetical protein
LPIETLQRYTGRYQFGPDAGIGTLTIVAGKLSLQLGSEDGMAFLPESATVFFFPSDRRVQLRFDASSDGQVELAYGQRHADVSVDRG